MAEYAFKKLVKGTPIEYIKINSAGTAAMPHYTIFGDLEEVMNENGLDFHGHSPTLLNEDILKETDLALVMTCFHKEEINRRFSHYKDKVFLLSGYVDGVDKDIDDPLGQGKDAYERTYNIIERYLERLVDKLKIPTGKKIL